MKRRVWNLVWTNRSWKARMVMGLGLLGLLAVLGGGSGNSGSSTPAPPAPASAAPAADGRWLTEKEAVARFRASAWGRVLLTSDMNTTCHGNGPRRGDRYADFWCFPDDSYVGTGGMDRIRPTRDGGLLLMGEDGTWSASPRQAHMVAGGAGVKHGAGDESLPTGVHWLQRGEVAETTCGRLEDIMLAPNNNSDVRLFRRAGIIGSINKAFEWCGDPNIQQPNGDYGRAQSTIVKLTHRS